MASGSEVQLALGAQKSLAEENIKVRVVSFPSWELFEAQDQAYKESVLPWSVRKRLAIEADRPWDGVNIQLMKAVCRVLKGLESPPAGQLMKEYGFTVEHVVARQKKFWRSNCRHILRFIV